MTELDWAKEIRHWVQGGKAEQSAKGLSDAFGSLRQNLAPLNKELRELNANTKKSKNLLRKIATLQEGVDTQTKWLIALTIVMVIFAVIQAVIGLIQIGVIKLP